MRLRISRILYGVNTHEVEQATGVDRAAINRYELGRLNPDTPRGRRVCSLLGIDPSWAFQEWKPRRRRR